MTGGFEDQNACPYLNAIHASLQSNLELCHVIKSYREHGKSSAVFQKLILKFSAIKFSYYLLDTKFLG